MPSKEDANSPKKLERSSTTRFFLSSCTQQKTHARRIYVLFCQTHTIVLNRPMMIMSSQETLTSNALHAADKHRRHIDYSIQSKTPTVLMLVSVVRAGKIFLTLRPQSFVSASSVAIMSLNTQFVEYPHGFKRPECRSVMPLSAG